MLRVGTRTIHSIFAFVLVVHSTCTNTVFAKSAPQSFPFSPIHKAAQLKYPSFPTALIERIHGKKRNTANPVRMDSALNRDWALTNIGFFDVFSPVIAPLKPQQTEVCSPEVVVAVVDTGIDYAHPELVDSIWINEGEAGPWEPPAEMKTAGVPCRDKSCNGIDDDGNGFVDDVAGWDFVHDVPLPYDTHGHGTHIAGIIASSAANGLGTSGVCPRASIMALKYYDNSGAGFNNLSNTVRAIQYAVKNGAQIINYSGGGADPAAGEKAAVEAALKKGILVVAAAGNDGHNNDQIPYYPASYGTENVISVASINKQNQLLPSSNFGRTVHVAAPGLTILSTLPEGKFGTMSGTSQATAFVTGTAALLASQNRKAGFDFRKIKNWITEGARPMRGNEKKNYLAGGLLSVPRSLQLQRESRRVAPVAPTNSAPEVAARPNPRSDIK